MKRRLAAWVAFLGLFVAPVAGAAPGYVIDPLASQVHILLNRAGVFSMLAHDHVLVAKGIAGQVTWDAQNPGRSAVQVTVPVGSIEIDPPEVRAALGLAGTLSENNRADVRQNMLAPNQLDGARHPRIAITLVGVSGASSEKQVVLRVRIKQAEQEVSVPVRVWLEQGILRASGVLELKQSAFGIEPYSALLGAIAVQDRVKVTFDLVARPLP